MDGQYEIGQLVCLAVRFFDRRGKNTDPATVTLQVKKPDGTITPYTYLAGEVTRDGLGLFHRNVTIDAAGRWAYRFVATGGGQAAGERVFTVKPSAF